MMSATSSGGVSSMVSFTASTICWTLGSIASRICALVTSIDRGRPVSRSRPRKNVETSSSIGSADPLDEEVSTFFRGRDLLTGLPRSIEVTSAQIREAIEPSVQQIVDAVKDTIEETPPELVADIMDQGIYVAGGGALLRGLDTRIAEATQMAVHIADDPLTCVARGTGKILEELV